MKTQIPNPQIKFYLLGSAWISGPLCLLVLLLGACASKPPAFSNSWSSLPAGAAPYRSTSLQQGDTLTISFAGSPTLNTTQKVQLDGTIPLPFLGDVQVVGKSPAELQAELIRLYEPQLKSKEITVALQANSATVYVCGAVLRPGKVQLDRTLTLLEAIMEVGGFDPNRAKLTKVTVYRLENGLQRSYQFNLKRILSGTDSGRFYLKPSDIVFVPEKVFNF